MNLVSICPYFK